jgi:hypothetical protein
VPYAVRRKAHCEVSRCTEGSSGATALPGSLAVEEAVTGFTLGDRHLRALRSVVESSRYEDSSVALDAHLLQALRELVRCDHIMFEGVDYLRGSSWFSQGNGYDVDWFSTEVEKGTFWDLVRSGNEVRPWIPDNNASIVTSPRITCPPSSGAGCRSMWTCCDMVRALHTN